jgi:hypothetical protein
MTLDDMIFFLRSFIDDTMPDEDGNYTYSDDGLRTSLLAAAMRVRSDFCSYIAVFCNINVSRDYPYLTLKDDLVIPVVMADLIVLKAACQMKLNQAAFGLRFGKYTATLGPATLSESDGGYGKMPKHLVDYDVCAQYEELKKQMLFSNPGTRSAVLNITVEPNIMTPVGFFDHLNRLTSMFQ